MMPTGRGLTSRSHLSLARRVKINDPHTQTTSIRALLVYMYTHQQQQQVTITIILCYLEELLQFLLLRCNLFSPSMEMTLALTSRTSEKNGFCGNRFVAKENKHCIYNIVTKTKLWYSQFLTLASCQVPKSATCPCFAKSLALPEK